MGRTYAGVLGPLAFALVLARGVIHGASATATMGTAIAALFVFAALGWVVGHLAAATVDQAVREKFNAEIEASQAAGGGPDAKPAGAHLR